MKTKWREYYEWYWSIIPHGNIILKENQLCGDMGYRPNLEIGYKNKEKVRESIKNMIGLFFFLFSPFAFFFILLFTYLFIFLFIIHHSFY